MAAPRFIKTEIGELENESLGGDMNTLFTVGDVNGDGRPDIVTAGRTGMMAWFENPGATGRWIRHEVALVENKECGGLVRDLTGSGRGDIINGGDWRSDELCWWENPGDDLPWQRRVIARAAGTQFHDEMIGDITGSGQLSLVFWNQGSQTLAYCPLPEDPRQSPWPDVRVIAAGMNEGGQPEEGLALADLDGDGKNEIVAGTHWYKFTGSAEAPWECHKFAADYISTVIAVGDIDGDGRPEVILSEGDACIYGKPQGGKVAWFKPGVDIRAPWEEHLIADGLLDPHSLQLGDICGAGRLDLLVGEIGVKATYEERPPRLMVFENRGGGSFARHIIDEGTGTHHARLVDLRGTGALDIASRPLHGKEKWKLFIWYNSAGGPPPQ